MLSISIILPVYNGMKYLRQAIESVLQQSYTDFEFLIIDDCSPDENCWQYLQTLSDKRITLFRNETNKGLFYNLNFLIKKSTAPLIKLWAQDDVMYPNCLEEIVRFHQLNSQVGFSYTGRTFLDADSNDIPNTKNDTTPAIVPSAMHAKIAFYCGSIAGNIANVTLSRFALDKVGLFNESMKISGDFEMWVRLAKEYPVGHINLPLVKLRNHKEQLSGKEAYYIYHLKEDIEAYKILKSYASQAVQKEGLYYLQNYKLMFYYTLMSKAFFKGHFKVGLQFWQTLSHFDNVWVLTGYFIKNKLLKIKALPFVLE